MANVATLSSTFRISVPKSVREHQPWEVGQKLVFIPKGNGVLLVPAPSLDDLRGIVRGADPDGYRGRAPRRRDSRAAGLPDADDGAARDAG